jgi:hypothetical protein
MEMDGTEIDTYYDGISSYKGRDALPRPPSAAVDIASELTGMVFAGLPADLNEKVRLTVQTP